MPERLCFSQNLSGKFNGETIQYRAIAGETHVCDEKAAPVASFFTVAYLKSNVENVSTRPVTFLFNGGPGSSAQWLHMGGFGPKRVRVPSEFMERMGRADSQEKAHQEGVAIAQEMVVRVRHMVQGVQLSAPFGRYQLAVEVAEAIGA